MMYENVIGFGSTISFLTLIFVTSFLIENNIARILLFILAFVLSKKKDREIPKGEIYRNENSVIRYQEWFKGEKT